MLEMSGLRKVYNPGTVRELCLFENFSLSIPGGSSCPSWAPTARASPA